MEEWEKTVIRVPSSSLVLCFKVSPYIYPSQEAPPAKIFKSVITPKDGQETLGRDAGGSTMYEPHTHQLHTVGAREGHIADLLKGRNRLSFPILLFPTWQNKPVLWSTPNASTFHNPSQNHPHMAKSHGEERERGSLLLSMAGWKSFRREGCFCNILGVSPVLRTKGHE